eukprot:m51a1_g12293 hypothetical protein (249) ;mRNA; r:314094-315201
MDDEIVTEIARVLCEVLRANETLEGNKVSPAPSPTPFDGPRAPSYPVDRYLHRIHRYTYCGSTCLLAALIYIDRAAMKQPDVRITSRNIHRLLITSVVVSMKFWSDQFFDNEYYARVGGISSKELCTLEIWFLRQLDFDLVIEPEVFEEYRNMLTNRCHSSTPVLAVPVPRHAAGGSSTTPAAAPRPLAAVSPCPLSLSSSSVPVGARTAPLVIVAFDALAGCGEGPSPSSSPMRCCLSRRMSPTGVV